MYEINYHKPTVTLLNQSGIGVSEIAGRTCYDSFDKSENECIQNAMSDLDLDVIHNIESSDLLDSLAWVHHHHSILEHTTLSFLVQGTSRGVLQEHARHRIQAISVKSTRYTMSSVINAFVASLEADNSKEAFINFISIVDLFVIDDEEYLQIEIGAMFDKLFYQYQKCEDFYTLSVAKSSLPFLEEFKGNHNELFEALQGGKKKRNVGDAFKHIVTDNWKVDMVVTFNLRSLKNYFDLRASGSAYFQIQWLAKAMKSVTPIKYLRLIDKRVM
ncbi:MAG: FAD-dependent thymidylate synthase [Sulfurovum sp.]